MLGLSKMGVKAFLPRHYSSFGTTLRSSTSSGHQRQELRLFSRNHYSSLDTTLGTPTWPFTCSSTNPTFAIGHVRPHFRALALVSGRDYKLHPVFPNSVYDRSPITRL